MHSVVASHGAMLGRVGAISMLLSACSVSNAYGSSGNRIDIERDVPVYRGTARSDDCLDDSPSDPFC